MLNRETLTLYLKQQRTSGEPTFFFSVGEALKLGLRLPADFTPSQNRDAGGSAIISPVTSGRFSPVRGFCTCNDPCTLAY